MKKIIELLNENPLVYLGTVKKDGTPDVRPFNFMLEKEGKLYFCTNAAYSAYAEIQNNSQIALSTMTQKFQWIRLYATVVFTDDIEIKEAIIAANETTKKIFGTADNPDMKPFYLENGTVTYYDYSGNPPETFTF